MTEDATPRQPSMFVRGNDHLDRLLSDPQLAADVAEAHAAEEEMDRVYAMNLAMIRKAAQMTQAEVARQLGVGQAAVSRLESREDMLLSTLYDLPHRDRRRRREHRRHRPRTPDRTGPRHHPRHPPRLTRFTARADPFLISAPGCRPTSAGGSSSSAPRMLPASTPSSAFYLVAVPYLAHPQTMFVPR